MDMALCTVSCSTIIGYGDSNLDLDSICLSGEYVQKIVRY